MVAGEAGASLWGVEWLQGGMRGCGGGMCGYKGACVVAGGVHGCWLVYVVGGGVCEIRRDTVNERAVRILLECILV